MQFNENEKLISFVNIPKRLAQHLMDQKDGQTIGEIRVSTGDTT